MPPDLAPIAAIPSLPRMCGRFSLSTNEAELYAEFGAVPRDYRPRYNIAPTQEVATVALVDGEVRGGWLRFGLIPSWAEDARGAARLINARLETVDHKPSFREAFRRRRCVVLADGFFEWAAAASGRRQPFHVRLVSGRPFGIAAIWERWQPPDGGPVLRSCALLTTEAPAALRPIHGRSPVMLSRNGWRDWLAPGREPDDLRALVLEGPGEPLLVQPVSFRVNSVAHDDPGCVEPTGPPVSEPDAEARTRQDARS
jgi:putative SOS response-associated peptidase YedK